MDHIIITENDVSDWNDETGIRYHYPPKYRGLIKPGVKFIYYKGADKEKSFSDFRLTDRPHYFGTGEIGTIEKETNSNSYYASINDYYAFINPVVFKDDDGYLEPLAREYFTKNDRGNYFRGNAVRSIDKETFNLILSKVSGYLPSSNNGETTRELTTVEIKEGSKKLFYTTKYERSKFNRESAIRIHGAECKCCGLNFEERYGTLGKGFIHIHHKNPLHTLDEEVAVNPETDLVPVCPNCHAMIHRRKDKLISVEELRQIINLASSTNKT